MIKSKKLAVLMLAGTMLLSCAACGKEESGVSSSETEPVVGTIGQVVEEKKAADRVFSVNYDPEAGINPIRAGSSTNMQFWSLMYDSVFIVDENFNVTSEVVTDYTTTDNVWWVFNINTDIQFSDGSNLRAQDIVYSIRRAQQYEYYANRLSGIYGISAMSDDCFAITTASPNSQFPGLLNIPIIKEGSIGDEPPMGTGPYQMAEEGDRLVLNNYNRHAANMPVDTVYLKDYTDTAAKITAFEDSIIDVVTNDPTGMYNLGYGSSNETRYYDTTNLHYLGFNMYSAYFQNFLGRYAVGYAVDRENIVSELMNGCGLVTTLPVHPRSSLYDEAYAETFCFDQEKSAALFTNAGVKDYDEDGALEIVVTGIVVELNIKFIVNNNSTVKVNAARQICETLNAMGITTTLYELSWEDYVTALEEGDYDMYYGELRMTPDWNLSALFKEYDTTVDKELIDKGLNYANCFDTSYCQLYDSYLTAADNLRYDAFQDICHYVCDSGAIIPICFEKCEVLTHRGVCSGIAATQYDLFNKFYDWTIDLK